jgi:(2Fe-2S) ferredoxin
MSDVPSAGHDLTEAAAEAQRRDVGGYRRHIFICTGPDCCSEEEGMAAWARLKRLVGDLNKERGEHLAYRTKVGCFRVCTQGPVCVVYPEGTWYALDHDHATLDRIVAEHLGEGRVVAGHVIGENPLPGPLPQ